MPTLSDKGLLLIGASRGLGYALAEEYLRRGWRAVAAERGSTKAIDQTIQVAVSLFLYGAVPHPAPRK